MKRLYSFKEARRIARSHGFNTQDEFLEYDCAGSYKLPKNVEELYASEWKGWDDFLGKPLSFPEGRSVARQLGLKNKEEYLKLKEDKGTYNGDDDNLVLRLPSRPDLYYKNWVSWEDWLDLERL